MKDCMKSWRTLDEFRHACISIKPKALEYNTVDLLRQGAVNLKHRLSFSKITLDVQQRCRYIYLYKER